MLTFHSNVEGVICLELTQIICNFNQVFFVFFFTIQRAKLELPVFVFDSVFEIIKN